MSEITSKIREMVTHKSIPIMATAAALSVAACSNGESGTNDPETPAPDPTTTQQPTSSPETAAPPNGGSVDGCQLEGAATEVALRWDERGFAQMSSLVGTAVELGDHDTNGECFEQVTVRFAGQPINDSDGWPGVHAQYVEDPVLSPSGNPVDIAGNVFLQVSFGAPMHNEATGAAVPLELDDDELAKVDLFAGGYKTEDYEGQSQYTFGLDRIRPFVVLDISGTPDCPNYCAAIQVQDNN